MGLTKQEQRIAHLLAAGYSQGEIALRMERSKYTIYTHVKNMRRKLGAESTPQLRRMLMGRPDD